MRVIFLILFVVSNLFASGKYDELLKSGREKAYNLKFNEAKDIYNKLIALDPNDPRAYHFHSQIHLWTFLGNNDENEYEVFLAFSEQTLKKAEKLLRENGDNPELLYLLGNIYAFRAMAFSGNNNVLDAFWASKSAVSYFDETLELDPKFYSAYMGLGMFDYALSFVPGVFSWALSLTGLSANKDRGLQYLLLAYEKGKYDKTESAFHLAKIYTEYIAEYDSAKIYLNKLIGKYPDNILFLYQKAILLMNDRKSEAAEEELNKVIILDHPNFEQTNALAWFLKGDIQFRLLNFERAISNYETFLISTRNINYTGIASLRMALCYKFLGDESSYKKYLLMARNGNLDIQDDIFAKNESERLFDLQLSQIDLDLIRAENLLSAGKYKMVKQILTSLVDTLEESEQSAKAKVLLADAYLSTNNLEEALKFSTSSLQNQKVENVRTIIYGNFITAKIFYIRKEFEKAKRYLSQAYEEIDYELNPVLSAKIKNLQRKIIH